MTRPTSICSPETYYEPGAHARMLQRRQQPEHQWIFDLLAGRASGEEVFIDNSQWMLCRDRHPGAEDRFLVVFKDTTLHTIRELRSAHVPMLLEVQHACRRFLKEHGLDRPPHGWRLYFNYMPSVLQLHLHVARSTAHSSTRIQPLACVVRHIRDNPIHYATALFVVCSRPAEHSRRRAPPVCAQADPQLCIHTACWRGCEPHSLDSNPPRASSARARVRAPVKSKPWSAHEAQRWQRWQRC